MAYVIFRADFYDLLFYPNSNWQKTEDCLTSYVKMRSTKQKTYFRIYESILSMTESHSYQISR